MSIIEPPILSNTVFLKRIVKRIYIYIYVYIYIVQVFCVSDSLGVGAFDFGVTLILQIE